MFVAAVRRQFTPAEAQAITLAARVRRDDPRRQLLEALLDVGARHGAQSRRSGGARPATRRSSPAVRDRAHTPAQATWRGESPSRNSRRPGPFLVAAADAPTGHCRRWWLPAAVRAGRAAPARRARDSGTCTQVQARNRPKGNAVDSLMRSMGNRPRLRQRRWRCRRAPWRPGGTSTSTRSESSVAHSRPMRVESAAFSSVTSSRACSPANASTVATPRTTVPTRLRWHRCIAISAEAGQQEGDQHGHAVRIVESREQHHQQQSRECEAAAGRQDVDAPRAQRRPAADRRPGGVSPRRPTRRRRRTLQVRLPPCCAVADIVARRGPGRRGRSRR